MIRKILLALAVTAASATFAEAQQSKQCPADRISLLMLGTFHMAGSTEDAVVFKFDDMGSPRRQAEILALNEKLGRFKPTKIAIESSRISTVWNERYSAWLDGKYKLGFNEIEQVGFRIAKSSNLKALTPVDYPMWMSGLAAIDRHEPKPRPVEASSNVQSGESDARRNVRRQLAEDEKRFGVSTVADYLSYLNSPVRAAENNRWDVISNLTPGDGVALYERTDLATNWYKRNLRIYTNLLETSAPGDRVLFIIGVGHVHLLRTLLSQDPRFCLVDIDDYLK